MLLQWQQLIEKRASDCFIDRVMAPDILAPNFQFAVNCENSSGMNAACAREVALRLAQCLGKRQQRFHINPDVSRSYRSEVLPDRIDVCLAAKTTTTGDRSEAFRRTQFQFDAGCQLHIDSVTRSY